jgi:hypothetical protein
MPEASRIAKQNRAKSVMGWGKRFPKYSTPSKKRVKKDFFGAGWFIEADELICSLLVVIPEHM